MSGSGIVIEPITNDDSAGGKEDDDAEEKLNKVKGGKKRKRKKRKKKKGILVTSACWGKRAAGGGDGCCLSFKPPRTQFDSDESPTSDPNSPEFTFDMLRDFIEKNDFYSQDCNPHLGPGKL